ncbi:metal ABC transporter solute-binding protein, Zn/Mn family [Pseudonocardia spinosispora]|uniref:metal ABC transporter solute-binding protein, Zn/Mn family n=1 Tax=Pseudonocardia spinosispora TaxID=103441 RepID=UPI0004131534|nr:zinc ABC transporter substrate-binding protein [Pseudonocardia spinosispora]
MTSRRAALLAATTALALTGLAGCGQPATPAQAPSTPGTVNVVASTDVYGSIATAIGRDHVHVTSIIHSPDADPHEYESTPNDAVAVGQAKVLIANGGGYDEFAGKLLTASGGHAEAIDVSKLSGLDTGENFNEHVFYSLPTISKLADTLAADLGKADPADAASFTANATAFKAQLDGLNTKLAAIKAGHNGARIAITEPVALYLTEAAGLVNATPEEFAHAVEDGNDPPAAVLQQTLALFQGPDKVSVLVLNGQTESAITNQVEQAANTGGVPVIKVTETLPAGTMDYVTWMGGQIDQLSAALGRRQ